MLRNYKNTKSTKEKRKLTLLLVPHSGKNILSVEINIFLLISLLIVVLMLVVFSLYSIVSFSNRNLNYHKSIQVLKEQNENVELLSKEIEKTRNLNNQFLSELDKTSKLINYNNNGNTEQLLSGDLSQTLTLSSQANNSGGDSTTSLIVLQQKISNSIPILEKANTILDNQQSFLKDIPIYLPVRNANISMEWGPNIHPVFGYWYIHKGIDFAANPGTPIYAAANGVVTFVNYDEGYGNHVYISHKFGFKTHYSHMKTFLVKKGEIVSQGQIIGTVGSTGIVTGPHLDFQMYLGSELIDPGRYIRYIQDYVRPKGTR